MRRTAYRTNTEPFGDRWYSRNYCIRCYRLVSNLITRPKPLLLGPNPSTIEMPNTPNHSYNMPSKGKQNWHVDLNENFDSLDRDTEIRDQEANKGNYEPRDGAKYVATDSGAVYFGNGNSWVLADRKVGSLRAEDINGALLTPQGDTIQAIQDLVDNYQNPHIKLQPGVLYEGDTQLVIDSYPAGNQEKTIRIDAGGAGINYTGRGKVCCQIQCNTEATDSGGNRGNAADAFGGSVTLLGGSWYGPGRDVADSCTIRQDDGFGNRIFPGQVRDAENGLLLRNKYFWNEGNEIGIKEQGKYSKDINSQPVEKTIRLAGGGSSYPITEGTGSYKNTHIRAPFISAADNGNGVAVWQDGGSIWGGSITIGGFVPDDGTFYRHDHDAAISRYCWLFIECEGGNENSINVEKNTSNFPYMPNPRLTGPGTMIGGSQPNIRRISTLGWEGGSFDVRLKNDVGFGNTWLKMVSPSSKDVKYAINNQNEAFTLQINNDSFVQTRGSDGSKVPFRGEEFQAEPDNGGSRRAFKGSFDEHPSTENGDTWYISGSGSPSEGFYGQTSNGVVQIG